MENTQEILQKIAELGAEARRLMQQASSLEEKPAKVEDTLARSTTREREREKRK